MIERGSLRAMAPVLSVAALFALVVLTGSAPLASLKGDELLLQIVVYSRLPRALTALLAGAALGLAGLSLQTLLGNPLAGPFVLGVNAAATAGVALLGLALPGLAMTQLGATFAAAVGAALSLILVLLLAARVGSILKLTIFGVLMGYGFAAVVTLALQLATPQELSAIVGWTFGSFGRTGYSDIAVLGGTTAAGALLLLLNAKRLDTLYLGPEEASLLGSSLKGLRLSVLFAAALLAGVVTSFCGPLAFVGVAAPHLARWIRRSSRHRPLMLTSMMLGGGVALLAELVAALPGISGRLPLNAVLSLLGIPVVLGVLLGLGGSQT